MVIKRKWLLKENETAKHSATRNPAVALLEFYLRTRRIHLHKRLQTNVYKSFVRDGPRLETSLLRH